MLIDKLLCPDIARMSLSFFPAIKQKEPFRMERLFLKNIICRFKILSGIPFPYSHETKSTAAGRYGLRFLLYLYHRLYLRIPLIYFKP
jgi:hypothetical protein